MNARFKSYVLPVLLLLGLLSTSCLIVSKQQLINDKRARRDKGLKGRWIGQDKLRSSYALFDDNLLETNIFTGKEPAKQSEVVFDLTTGVIGKYKYMSLHPHDETNAEYLLVRYAIDGSEMKVWVLDSTLIDAAISDGRLKKTVSDGSSTTILSDPADKVVAFIIENEHSDDLFDYLGTFRKEKK